MSYQRILQYAREMRKHPTPAEQFFWEKVRNRKFLRKKFNRQFIFHHETIMEKKRYFIGDFYCHEMSLIIEIDGGIHKQQVEYDQIREEILIKMGYTIIRFSNEDVLQNWEDVKKELAEALGS